MASSSPTCDSTPDLQWNYDVFLSFKGKDTGKTFTDHLYRALDENGFYVFRGDEKFEEEREIAPELLKAIVESKISILVFSKNYAYSRLCLDELETIIKSMKEPGRMVVPVFYHVDPSEVRNQTGSYREALSRHERDAADEEEKKDKVEKWRASLRDASNLAGWHLQNQYESQFIKEIISDVLRRLNCELLKVDQSTFGMESRLKKLLTLINLKLDEVRMIGIYGTSGIGKTTIAKAIYNKISYQFQSTFFHTNVLEDSRSHEFRLPQFQQLDDITMEPYGIVRNKKVLLVVDDVDSWSQVANLVKLRDSFGPRSRIILTTRDKHLLNLGKVDASYEAEELTNEEASQLFSWHAFKQTYPKEDYSHLVKHVVGYAKGHPLALKVLGSSLFGKTRPEWECILRKLRKNTHGEVFNLFKISFDGLTPTEQEIFLKVVCLLKGKYEEFVSTILDSLGLGAASGIQVLHDMCLVTVSNNNLHMHDLLQQMGQKLIRENNPQQPKNRSRSDYEDEDMYHRSTKNTIQSSSAGFQCMKSCKVDLPLDFEFPSLGLMYRQFSVHPLKALPSNFDGDNLVGLDFSYSKIRRLWKGNKILPKLKVMSLSYCQNLVEMPKLSSMPALEILTLKGCKNLRSLPSSMCELKCLKRLERSGSSNLKTFPEITEKMENLKELHEMPKLSSMPALEILTLKGCKNLRSLPSSMYALKCLNRLKRSGSSNLKTFPEIEKMENLKELHLDETAIKELPSSIEHLTVLEVLNLARCKSLASLPSCISKLKHLKGLWCSGCSSLQSLPEITNKMENLKELYLDETAVKELPSSIEHLTVLEVLNLARCKSLASLPSCISKLKHLKGLWCSGCSSLQSLPEITEKMENLKELYLDETAVKELPSSIEHLTALEHLNLARCKSLASLPRCISKLKHLKSLCLDGCSNLHSFPEITRKMEYLKELYLGETAIKELPSSIEHLTALEVLNLTCCKNLDSLSSGTSKLERLKSIYLYGCSNLKSLQQITEKVELKELYWNETPIKEFPSYLRSLKTLSMKGPSKLKLLSENPWNLQALTIQRPIRGDMSYLYFLTILDLSNCNLIEGRIPNSISHLSSLKSLNLSGNHFISIPANISQLRKLRFLGLSHCKRLQSIPELPSSINCVEVHECIRLKTLSIPSLSRWKRRSWLSLSPRKRVPSPSLSLWRSQLTFLFEDLKP